MKEYILILSCIILLVCVVSADIRVTINTAQVVFRNTTGSTFSYHLEVENKNNFPVTVTITPPEDLNIQFQGPLNFNLSENETKDIPYSGIIKNSGEYVRTISVKYEGNGSTFALASTLMFIVPETEESQTSEIPEIRSSSSHSSNVPQEITSVNNTLNGSANNISEFNLTRESVQKPTEEKIINSTLNSTSPKQETIVSPKTDYTIILIGFIFFVLIIICLFIFYLFFKRRYNSNVDQNTV